MFTGRLTIRGRPVKRGRLTPSAKGTPLFRGLFRVPPRYGRSPYDFVGVYGFEFGEAFIVGFDFRAKVARLPVGSGRV